MTTKTDAQAIAELVWFAEMSATRCHDLGERNEKLRAELEAANARIAELKAELAIVTAQRDAREEELVTRMVQETEVPHE